MSVSRSLLLKECLDKCNIIDIGFTVACFTWTNKRPLQTFIQEQIDRFSMNPSWCLLFPDSKVVHLTRCHSDHCPILPNMQPRTPIGRKTLFRFQSCWLSDPSFPNVVSQAWHPNPSLVEADKVFTEDAANWNRLSFGNIFEKKKNIMTRLNGIQRVILVRPSNFLLNLENELQQKLDLVFTQDEELWALKSRVNWMIQGDRNTLFTLSRLWLEGKETKF